MTPKERAVALVDKLLSPHAHSNIKSFFVDNIAVALTQAHAAGEAKGIESQWRDMASAPHDAFILLWCPEDQSRWLAKWQGERWYGVDDLGLIREGHSIGGDA